MSEPPEGPFTFQLRVRGRGVVAMCMAFLTSVQMAKGVGPNPRRGHLGIVTKEKTLVNLPKNHL